MLAGEIKFNFFFWKKKDVFLEFNGMHFKETLPNRDDTILACELAHVQSTIARGVAERRESDPRLLPCSSPLRRVHACGLIFFILITSLLLTLLQTCTRSFWQQSGLYHQNSQLACLPPIGSFNKFLFNLHFLFAYFSVPNKYISAKWSVLNFCRRL